MIGERIGAIGKWNADEGEVKAVKVGHGRLLYSPQLNPAWDRSVARQSIERCVATTRQHRSLDNLCSGGVKESLESSSWER